MHALINFQTVNEKAFMKIRLIYILIKYGNDTTIIIIDIIICTDTFSYNCLIKKSNLSNSLIVTMCRQRFGIVYKFNFPRYI